MSPKRDYLDELNDPTRRAAGQGRPHEPPPAAMHRAVERTRRALRAKRNARPRFRRDLLAIAGMAATILLGIVMWNSFRSDAPELLGKKPDGDPVDLKPEKPMIPAEDECRLHSRAPGQGTDNEKDAKDRGKEDANDLSPNDKDEWRGNPKIDDTNDCPPK